MSSSSSVSSPTTSPTGTSNGNSNANVAPASRTDVHQTQLIAICVVVGFAAVVTVVLTIIGCRKRDSRSWHHRVRRAATPVSDAEFDKWRNPTKDAALYSYGGSTIYRSTGLRYDGLKSPAPLVHAFRVPSSTKLPTTTTRPATPPRPTRKTTACGNSPAASVRPLIHSTTASSIDTRRSRHKSSVTLHDRPPTPYSPSSPPSTWDNETVWQEEAPMSPRERQHKAHVSDTSDFTFELGYGSPDSPRREPVRRESWVHHSRRFSSLGSIAHPNYQEFRFDLEQGKKMDY